TECGAGHGCARPIADIQAPRPLDKCRAPPQNCSHRTQPSGDPEPLESPRHPFQISSSTIAVDAELLDHMPPRTGVLKMTQKSPSPLCCLSRPRVVNLSNMTARPS